MNKLIFILLILGFPIMAINPNPLEKYIWKNRVIVTFSPNENHIKRNYFLSNINRNLCEVNSRDIVHIDLLFSNKNNNIEKFGNYYTNLFLSQNEFRLILIGKDGGIKLDTTNSSLDEIFSLIDTMPMRQEEMIHDNC